MGEEGIQLYLLGAATRNFGRNFQLCNFRLYLWVSFKGLQCKSGISNVPLFFYGQKNVRFSRFLSFLDKINRSVRVFSELRSQRIAEASRERLYQRFHPLHQIRCL